MSRTFPPVLLLLAAVLGCGGHYHGSPGARSADAFVGTWEGSYATQSSAPASDRHGTMRIVIRRAHSTDTFVGIEGTAVDATEGSATVSGIIHDGPSSENDLFLGYSGDSGDVFEGAPTKAANGHLVGPIYLSRTDIHVPTDLDLAPVSP